jgi:membrane protease YdiL (CAAX protease family)
MYPLVPPADARVPDARRERVVAFVRAHRKASIGLAAALAVLVAVNVLDKFGPPSTSVVLGPLAAVGLVVLGRISGLTWHDLGLARRQWPRGLVYAVAAVIAVAVVYAGAAAVPETRVAFLDTRYRLPFDRALVTALVMIPLGTVIVEEVAFRGVLMGLLTRLRNMRWGLGISSALFGLWHVLPSLRLQHANAAVHGVAGNGALAGAGVVAAAVLFTTVAGLLLGELRRRSGSLVASAGLHWAVNGLGVLVATLLPRVL